MSEQLVSLETVCFPGLQTNFARSLRKVHPQFGALEHLAIHVLNLEMPGSAWKRCQWFVPGRTSPHPAYHRSARRQSPGSFG